MAKPKDTPKKPTAYDQFVFSSSDFEKATQVGFSEKAKTMSDLAIGIFAHFSYFNKTYLIVDIDYEKHFITAIDVEKHQIRMSIDRFLSRNQLLLNPKERAVQVYKHR